MELGGTSDELAFSPDGKRVYVSMGKTNQVAVVDAATRTVVTKIGVGTTPHGIRVRPDGKELYVTNTAENTVSVLTLGDTPSLAITFRVGADPFEVTFSPDGARAYVSDFLSDAVTVIDTASRATVATIRIESSRPSRPSCRARAAGRSSGWRRRARRRSG